MFCNAQGDCFIPNRSPEGGVAPAAGAPAPRGPRTHKSTPARGSGAAGLQGSDGEGDEAVVTLNVPLEDLGAGAQHALEAGPVQLDALEGPPGHHGGRPGPVQQQRNLPWGARGWSGARPPRLPTPLRYIGFQQMRAECKYVPWSAGYTSAWFPVNLLGPHVPRHCSVQPGPPAGPRVARDSRPCPPAALHLRALPGTPQ